MDLQELLNKWNIKCDVNTVLAMWNESHRAYLRSMDGPHDHPQLLPLPRASLREVPFPLTIRHI